MTNQEFIESISLPNEEWRDVVGYEGLYMVSNIGRVASLSRSIIQKNGIPRCVSPTILKQRKAKNGYLTVLLYHTPNKRLWLVHRIVALAFIPNPEDKPCVDHIDRNRANNDVNNLRWCTYSENMLNPLSTPFYRKINLGRKRPYAYRPVVGIKDDIVVYRFDKLTDCVKYGFNYTSVSSCCNGRRKTCGGVTFMYLSDYETLINMSKNS